MFKIKKNLKSKVFITLLVLITILMSSVLIISTKLTSDSINDNIKPLHEVYASLVEESIIGGLQFNDAMDIEASLSSFIIQDLFSYIRITNKEGVVLYQHRKENLTDITNFTREQLSELDNEMYEFRRVKSGDDFLGEVTVGLLLEKRNESLSSIKLIFILLMLGSIAGFISISFFFMNKMINPINKIAKGAANVAAGDMSVHIAHNSSDEIGELSNSFNVMVKNLKESNENLQAEKLSIQHKIEAAVKDAEGQKEYLSESVNSLLIEMNKFASGDLTLHLAAQNDDEIGKLYTGFNKAIQNIKQIILKVAHAAEATTSASNQISSSTEEMAAGAQDQSAQASDVASAIEQMTQTIVESANNAKLASDASIEASNQAKDGASKVEESKRGMDAIVSSSENTGKIIASLSGKTDQIGEIAQVIDDIADQTNLLALNAAIEAARAGEQGRGFAVVADEVRKLAERTTKATKEIADTIRAIQNEAKEADASMGEARNSVQKGISLTEEVDTVLKNILISSENVERQINQVATASIEQTTAAEQISRSIDGINNVTNESAVGTQQIAQTAEELNELTENLKQLINNFKLDEAGTPHD